MLEQYDIQYDLNGCCLRAPWIMEKDDFKYQLSFGEDVFGGPRWRDLVGAEQADEYVETTDGPGDARSRRASRCKRNFVHVERSGRRDPARVDHPQGAPADLQYLHG